METKLFSLLLNIVQPVHAFVDCMAKGDWYPYIPDIPATRLLEVSLQLHHGGAHPLRQRLQHVVNTGGGTGIGCSRVVVNINCNFCQKMYPDIVVGVIREQPSYAPIRTQNLAKIVLTVHPPLRLWDLAGVCGVPAGRAGEGGDHLPTR